MCEQNSIVRPCEASSLSSPLTTRAALASRPFNGSSRKSTSGLLISAALISNLLLHSLRVLGEELVACFENVEDSEQLGDLPFRVIAFDPSQVGHHREVLACCQRFVEGAVLGHVAQAFLDFHGILLDVESGDPRHTARRLDHAGQDLHGGRLPRAVRAEKAENLPRLDAQVEILDGGRVTEGASELAGFDHLDCSVVRAKITPKSLRLHEVESLHAGRRPAACSKTFSSGESGVRAERRDSRGVGIR